MLHAVSEVNNLRAYYELFLRCVFKVNFVIYPSIYYFNLYLDIDLNSNDEKLQ